jgi:hypothetical protein
MSNTVLEQAAITLHDIVSFRENDETPAAGHVTRVWDTPARDPYVTISSEGRTFVRLSSQVVVTQRAAQCDYGSDREYGWCEQPSAFTVQGEDGAEGESCPRHLAWTVAWLEDDGKTAVTVTRKEAG